jgi:hypothetical protein
MKLENTNLFQRQVNRRDFITILKTAFEAQSYRYIRQSCQAWLSKYPGDLEITLTLARAYFCEGLYNRAVPILEKLSHADPEYLEVYQLLDAINRRQPLEQVLDICGSLYLLGSDYEVGKILPEWSTVLKTASNLAKQGKIADAEKGTLRASGLKSDLELIAIYHLKLEATKQDDLTLYQLANLYHSRWQDCLQFKLYLAQAKMKSGEENEAVNLLHECVSQDTTGQVAERLWGKDHSYRPIWPETLEIVLDIPIPASVAAKLGLNILAAGEMAPKSTSWIRKEGVRSGDEEHEQGSLLGESLETITRQSQTNSGGNAEKINSTERSQVGRFASQTFQKSKSSLKSVEDAFGRLAKKLRQPEIAKSDGRFPMYIIFSSKTGLAEKYGRQTAAVIDKEMRNLCELLSRREGWGSMVFYPDEAYSTAPLGLNVVDSVDPWKLKLTLADLDKALAKKGEMVGALLIIGGHDVVPFHKLPNPTDDMDQEVLSDNPYSTTDSNYFVPEWPVGRLPGETGQDAGLLLTQIRNLSLQHMDQVQEESWLSRIIEAIRNIWLVGRTITARKGIGTKESFGYTAAVWKMSSRAAFQPIADGQSLMVCPPQYSGNYDPETVLAPKMGYFNLHGMPDSADWYGQREVSDTSSAQDYPVAISPKDIIKNGHSPKIVFSEACYGAYTLEKSENESVALKYLGIGTPAMVGSTCISYGSIMEPLIGADLLAHLFWQKLNEDNLVGEAFMKAKIDFVKEMNKRQGFLDGEDQKTLLSFVLYGDPHYGQASGKKQMKTMLRSKYHEQVKTMNDWEGEIEEEPKVASETILEIKQMVECYLPGIDMTRIRVHRQQVRIENSMDGPDGAYEVMKSAGIERNDTREQVIITVSKEVRDAQHIHRHYVRAKLNSEGKVVKLAISR